MTDNWAGDGAERFTERDDLVKLIPWYWGMLWMGTEDTSESSEIHLLTPRIVAMVALARERPGDFRRLLHAANDEAKARYQHDFERQLITTRRQLRTAQRFKMVGNLVPELSNVLRLAREFSKHWHDQDGVNAGILDALANAVRRFEESMVLEGEREGADEEGGDGREKKAGDE